MRQKATDKRKIPNLCIVTKVYFILVTIQIIIKDIDVSEV